MKAKIQQNKKVIYPDLSYTINGILFSTHKKLGRFCNEKQYGDYIELLLNEKGIHYERERELAPSFPGENKRRNIVDFLIEEKIILEIKSKPFLTKSDYYQTKRYIIAARLKLAVLVNMNRYSITPKRILNSEIEAKEEDYYL